MKGLFRQIEIAQQTDQRRQDTTRVRSVDGLNLVNAQGSMPNDGA